MSATKGKTHASNHAKDEKKEHSRVPIVDVFDEDTDEQEKPRTVQPARAPVVVEIESVLDQSEDNFEIEQEELAPPAPPKAKIDVRNEESRSSRSSAPEVIMESSMKTDEPLAEPALPSFFADDLQGRTPEQSNVRQAPQSPEIKVLENTVPQAFVGEINEIGEDVKSEKKKLVGVLFIVVAVLLFSLGLLVWYAKSIQQSNVAVSPTPDVMMATPKPTAISSPTPVATTSGSLTATASGSLADLKKKVKVDVLNGTKIAGLASKEAAVLKKAGFTTGTVGNGVPENAGTIVVSTPNMVLAQEIQKALPEFTFTITKNEKLTVVQVTLGEPKE